MPITKYSKSFRASLLKKFEAYIEETECPFIEEFGTKHNFLIGNLKDFPEFASAIKKTLQKSKAFLLRSVADGGKQANISHIFLLKACHGLRDQTPINVNAGDNRYLQINLNGKTKEELEDLAVKRMRQLKARRIGK